MRGVIAAVTAVFVGNVATAEQAKVRLFILSGQSNMAGLDPAVSFTPAVKSAFPSDEIVVVKSAQGGQPIRRWHKAWKPPENAQIKVTGKNGDLYDTLMAAVKKASTGKKFDTVSFVWMQGERDAREGLSAAYAESLRGLIDQLQADLERKDITVVIGRLSDHATDDSWKALRQAQVSYAEKAPRTGWVDTDDLNGPKDGLHYTKDGYAELGRRFAKKTVDLLTAPEPKK